MVDQKQGSDVERIPIIQERFCGDPMMILTRRVNVGDVVTQMEKKISPLKTLRSVKDERRYNYCHAKT